LKKLGTGYETAIEANYEPLEIGPRAPETGVQSEWWAQNGIEQDQEENTEN